MNKNEETRLRDLLSKEKDDMPMTKLDRLYLKKLTAKKRNEEMQPEDFARLMRVIRLARTGRIRKADMRSNKKPPTSQTERQRLPAMRCNPNCPAAPTDSPMDDVDSLCCQQK